MSEITALDRSQQRQSQDSLAKFKLKTESELQEEKEREEFFKQRQDRMDRQDEINHKITGGGLAVRDFGKAFRIRGNVKKFVGNFQTVFEKKHYENFMGLTQQIDDCLVSINGKMKDTMSKKEYELLHSFQTAIEKMAQELKQTQEKYKELEEIMVNDKRVQALEKHLVFFRDQCSELKELKTEADKQIEILKAQYQQEKTEREINRCALIRTEEECQGLRTLMEQKQNAVNDYKNQIQEFEEERLSLSQQVQEQNQIIQQLQENQNQNNNYGGENVYLTQQEQFNDYDIQQQEQDNQSRNNSSNINYRSSNKEIEQQILLKQINDNQQNPKIQMQILKEYIQEQFQQKDEQIKMFQDQHEQNDQEKQQIIMQNLANQNVTQENELRELFILCVKDSKRELNKRDTQLQQQQQEDNQFSKFERVELFKKFVLSHRFMEIVKHKIFNEKCCYNANCLYNIKGEGYFENKKDFDIYQTKIINKKIGDIFEEKDSKKIIDIENKNFNSSLSLHKSTQRVVQKPSYLNTSQQNNQQRQQSMTQRSHRSMTQNQNNQNIYDDQKTQRVRKQSFSNMTQKAEQFYQKQGQIQKQGFQIKQERIEKNNQEQIRQVKQRHIELYRHEKLYDKRLGERVNMMLKEFGKENNNNNNHNSQQQRNIKQQQQTISYI